MAADHTLEEALVREAIEAALLAVTGRRGKHQREIRRVPLLQKSPLQAEDQLVRRADADEPRDAHGIAVAHNGDCLVGGDDLVLERHSPTAFRRATWRSRQPSKA